MKALILAGGRGTRLRPITDYLPKPLVPVSNVPIIKWQLRHLGRHGIRDVVVCAGYRMEQIKDHLSRDSEGARIEFSIEKEPLGTAGAIKRAARRVRDGSFVVMNGDVITDIDIGMMLGAPNSVAAVPLRTGFGVMEVGGSAVTGFGEKPEIPGTWMNAGIYHLDKGAVRDMPAKGDIERTLFPRYARKGLLSAVKFTGARWHSIDSFRDLEECSAHVLDMGY